MISSEPCELGRGERKESCPCFLVVLSVPWAEHYSNLQMHYNTNLMYYKRGDLYCTLREPGKAESDCPNPLFKITRENIRQNSDLEEVVNKMGK